MHAYYFLVNSFMSNYENRSKFHVNSQIVSYSSMIDQILTIKFSNSTFMTTEKVRVGPRNPLRTSSSCGLGGANGRYDGHKPIVFGRVSPILTYAEFTKITGYKLG